MISDRKALRNPQPSVGIIPIDISGLGGWRRTVCIAAFLRGRSIREVIKATRRGSATQREPAVNEDQQPKRGSNSLPCPMDPIRLPLAPIIKRHFDQRHLR